MHSVALVGEEFTWDPESCTSQRHWQGPPDVLILILRQNKMSMFFANRGYKNVKKNST